LRYRRVTRKTLKRTLAAIITILVLGLALWFGRGRPAASPSPATSGAATPEACIERMFDAAKQGDVAAYLNCFTGPERQRLQRDLAGQPQEAFRQSLVDAVATLKGRAVFASSPVGDPSQPVIYTVDRVYDNRTERQTYELVCEAGTWRIRDMQAANAFQPDKAYGTPVYEE
jgi:hypothetical protein